MALEHSEVQAIKKEILDEAKNMFVQIDDCSEKQESVNKKLAKDDKRIEIIMHDFKTIKWLISAVAGASGGSLVTAIIDLLSK